MIKNNIDQWGKTYPNSDIVVEEYKIKGVFMYVKF